MILLIGIYGIIASFLLMFFLPLGFMAYHPASFLLGKTQDILLCLLLGVLMPAFALLLMLVAFAFWRLV